MVTKDLGLVTAYAYAVAGGYTGTEEEFQALLGNIAIDLAEIENLSVTVTTLPAGSSATASYDSGVLSLGIPKGDKGDSGDVANVAPEFSTSTPYDEGDYVIYNDLLYKFKTAKAAGAWDSTKVEAKTVGDELTDLKEDIKDNYAKNDGYYDGMTVGNAEQIVGTVFEEDDTAYNRRTTGGSAEVGDRAYVDAIVGGSLPWNQMASIKTAAEVYGITRTAVGTTGVKYTGTSTNTTNFTAGYKTDVDVSHVFLCSLGVASLPTGCSISFSDTDKAAQSIVKSVGFNGTFGVTISNGTTVDFTVYPQLFDLTAMFGSTIADYIYSLETAHAGDGVAWFKRYFPKPYYAYHAVGMEHVNAVAAKTVGFNQWDEEWESGYYDSSGAFVANSGFVASKNKIKCFPNTEYYFMLPDIFQLFYYDANGDFLEKTTSMNPTSNPNVRKQTTPNGAYFINFYIGGNYGGTYKHDISISIRWDNSRDGDYEPYNLHTYPLADITLRGIPKKDESGNLYFDGDRYLPDGTVERRYAEVDLGTLEWQYYNGMHIANIRSGGQGFDKVFGNLVCPIYTLMDNSNYSDWPNMSMRNTNDQSNPIVRMKNTSYTDAASFKAAMSGVYLVYELLTPTTEEADPYKYPMVVDNWGTEELIDGKVESGDRDVAIPVGHETKYPPNLKDKLESAANNPDADGAYILTHDGGSNTYTPLASNPTIQNIIARLEALEGGGE